MQRSLGIPLVLVVELAVAVVLVVPVLAHHLAAHVVVLPLVLLVLLVPVARVPTVPLVVVVVALLLVVATALAVVPLVPVALSTLVRVVVVVAGSRLDAHVVARALPRDEAVRRGRPGATADELKHGSCCWSGRGERDG